MDQISIRSLQHYLYCPHRWGLIEIDRSWAENSFVTKANIAHERAHSGVKYSSKGNRTFTAVSVWHDGLGLYGVTDCIEMRNGKITIVEYKPTQPSGCAYQEADALQVFAQKVCVDEIFHCDADAVIYFTDVKKRVSLPFRQEYETYMAQLKQLLQEMRERLAAGTIPPVPTGQYCGGCSMKDLCLPQTRAKRYSLQLEIKKTLEASCGNC